jgi:signal transduction histidine kinase
MLELIVLCFSIVANLVLAVLVFVQNIQKNMNRYFALFALALVCWSIANYISVHPIVFGQLFWIRLDMAAAVFLSMTVLLLVNVFPTGRPFYHWIGKLYSGIGTVLALSAMTPWLFIHLDYTAAEPQPVPGLLIIPFAIYTIGALGVSMMILIRRFFHFTGKERAYIRFTLLGIILTFALLIIFNFIAVVVFHNTSFIAFTPAFVLIFSVSFAYGMIRHQLFDIRLIVARFITYLLLLLVSGVLYGLATVVVSFFVVGVQPNVVQVTMSTIVVGVLILFVQPLRQFFDRITRAIFYQDDYDTKDVLDQLATVLVRSTDTDILATSSMTVLKNALKPDHITMVLIGSTSKQQRTISIGKGARGLAHFSAATTLQTIPDVMVTDVKEGRADRVRTKMRAMNVAVVARLETQGGVIGYCFFGYKTSGSAYGHRDIDLIRIARDELAVAIQNALRFDEIRVFNDTLQQRIEEATRELRASNTQLQRLDEAKDEFVSMASHQLRTPLTSVKGYISMVLEGDAGKITESQRQLLSEAFTSSERMVHLISDFLNVSRLQTGKFVLEQRRADLSKIVTQEIDSLQTTARAHHLTLEYRAPSYFPLLYLDESKIRQVLMNFIDNAIYYSEEGTMITVRLAIENGFAVLEVHNTGIGVPKSEQAHLFTKFFRATNARKQRPDGTGVGLFLAKKVVVSHGGTMVFESVEDAGSTFGFRLPVKKLSAAPTKQTNKLAD